MNELFGDLLASRGTSALTQSAPGTFLGSIFLPSTRTSYTLPFLSRPIVMYTLLALHSILRFSASRQNASVNLASTWRAGIMVGSSGLVS